MNQQPESRVPEQIRATAQQDAAPVVDASVTVPAGDTNFPKWQLDQLQALATALNIPA